MSAGLTRRQQRMAHAYGGPIACLICRCQTVDVAHIKQGQRCGTDLGGLGSYETTSKGIQLGYRWEPVVDVLTWSALSRHIDALPESVRDNPAHRDAHNPPGFDEPFHVQLNNRSRPSEATHLARMLWSDYTRENTRQVLDAAFPLAVDVEPADLFELAGIAAPPKVID